MVLFLLLLVLWEGVKLFWALPAYKLPHTYEILAEFFRTTGRGELWIWVMMKNGAITWYEAFTGFVFGGLAGFGLAVLFTYSRLCERGLMPWVVMSQTVPLLAIAPMVVVWLGTSWVSKAVIASYLTFFPVTINALRGFQSVNPDAVDLMYSYAANERQIFWKLRLPAAVPYIFTAGKISATASVIGAIVGELPAGSSSGIGVVILNAAQYYNFRPPNLWAAIFVAALVGILFYALVALAERCLVRWQQPAG